MSTEKQNYKIKVANEAESKEAQKLFFGLGYEWGFGGKSIQDAENTIYAIFGIMQLKGQFYTNEENIVFQELTLPQLRDLAVLHRNDVSDATHEVIGNNDPLFITNDGVLYYFHVTLNQWQKHGSTTKDVILSDYAIPLNKQPQMTWQDALRAVADGKEVELCSLITNEWISIQDKQIEDIVNATCEFRLKPQTVFIDAGHYTKEELLKIAGEMA